jgi:hypothetical protein
MKAETAGLGLKLFDLLCALSNRTNRCFCPPLSLNVGQAVAEEIDNQLVNVLAENLLERITPRPPLRLPRPLAAGSRLSPSSIAIVSVTRIIRPGSGAPARGSCRRCRAL